MSQQKFKVYLFISFIVSTALMFFGCSSSKQHDVKSAEETYNEAMELFNDEDYLESEKLFELIRLQYSASQFADDAQFYLAESNFKRKEYIYAAYNYNMLRRIYPHSEYTKKSLFQSGMCYYKLSPEYDRDQDYTVKAIQSFSEFQTVYPDDSLYSRATEYIKELREKLAHREYFTAELYRKMFSPESAVIYFDTVINDYPDTEYYEPALFGKIEILIEMKKNDEARSLIDLYKKLFPGSQNLEKLKTFEQVLK
ncbi:MAG: outer membrane protein assembly factor BamD [Ignavibacteriae bacterium]|nr:outer membrane protein assembly factor BamD [Ignavibacteriota bacterium]